MFCCLHNLRMCLGNQYKVLCFARDTQHRFTLWMCQHRLWASSWGRDSYVFKRVVVSVIGTSGIITCMLCVVVPWCQTLLLTCKHIPDWLWSVTARSMYCNCWYGPMIDTWHLVLQNQHKRGIFFKHWATPKLCASFFHSVGYIFSDMVIFEMLILGSCCPFSVQFVVTAWRIVFFHVSSVYG